MASAAEGEVAVLIVVSASHGETDEDRARPSRPSRSAARRSRTRAAERGADRPETSVHVVAGDRPADALSSYARDRGFDVLVVGRHGRERAAHGGLGRVARELAEKARFPLLLVGDGGPEAE